jgi:hypothetical protein
MNPTRGIVGCCARAASGNVAAVPPRRVMNCRRLKCALYIKKPTIGGCIVHHGKIIRLVLVRPRGSGRPFNTLFNIPDCRPFAFVEGRGPYYGLMVIISD